MSEPFATADDILSTPFHPDTIHRVAVPEWGGKTVGLKPMTSCDRDSYEFWLQSQGETPKNFVAQTLVRVLVNPETGQRIFSDDQADDLGNQPASVLRRLATIVSQQGLQGDIDTEEAQGKSQTTPDCSGNSILPDSSE